MNTPLNPDAVEKASREVFREVLRFNKSQSTRVARRAIEAYLAAAQPVVNSVEELDKLPVGAVILDGDPCVLQMVEKSSIVGSEWAVANEEHIYTTGKITLPARVLYRPEVPGA